MVVVQQYLPAESWRDNYSLIFLNVRLNAFYKAFMDQI